MRVYRTIQLVGIVGLIIAGVLFWKSYQRVICTMPLSEGAVTCMPNLNYLFPAIAIVIVSIVFIGYGRWKVSVRTTEAG